MQTVVDVEPDENAARKFLKGLKEHLNSSISLPDVREWIQKKEDFRPTGKGVQYELLFTDELVLPAVSKYLGKALGLSPTDERVRKAFLAESKLAKKQGWTSDSPRSANKYLFTKVFGANPKSVVKSWWGDSKKGQTCQSCPDWAFRDPCPHTVFEGKLFRKGGIDAARTELVSGIYQCFYYLSHPKFPPTETHPAWDYEYACLFAYDASREQSLVKAWNTLSKEVREACWGGASNIFVMVLPEK
ncbi:MAG: hypothetical protein WB952_09410 [Terriglobales bacterium]